MIIKGNIDDLLKEWATTAMTDPWPMNVAPTSPDHLTFTALVRCACGAGMARQEGGWPAWGCSDILTGQATRGPDHSELYPIAMWKFKSENHAATTRPGGL